MNRRVASPKHQNISCDIDQDNALAQKIIASTKIDSKEEFSKPF